MRSRLALAVVLAVTAGTVPATAAVQSGIRGIVVRSPISPVCRAGAPCSAPAAGVVLLVVRGRSVVARPRTAADGSFRVAVAPGTYVLRLARPPAIGGLSPRTVRVRASRFTLVRLVLDTGIR